jgi:hypothetical protein
MPTIEQILALTDSQLDDAIDLQLFGGQPHPYSESSEYSSRVNEAMGVMGFDFIKSPVSAECWFALREPVGLPYAERRAPFLPANMPRNLCRAALLAV